MQLKYWHIVFVLFLSFSSKHFSQNTDSTYNITDLFQMDLDAFMNIDVTSASKIIQKPSEAPNIINVYNNDHINIYGYTSINELLYAQPGFFPAQDYERRTLGFRGMFEGWNNNHVVLLIDGLPFNDNLYGTAYTWENTPLMFAKSIEIIRGPGGALYGTNAMNGVISLNTLQVSDFINPRIIRTKAGTLNTKVFDFITGQENSHLGVVAGYHYFSTDGNEYLSFDGSGRTIDTINNSLRKIKTNDSRTCSYFFNKIYAKGKYEGLSIQFHDQRWGFETGHGWLFAIPDKPEDMKENRNIITLRYAPKKNKTLNYEISTRYQKHQQIWNMRYYPENYTDENNILYPFGVSEFLNTKAEDVFSRIQADVKVKDNILLIGTEADYFWYKGDAAHFSNINMNEPIIKPDSTGKIHDLNPWFEFINNKPVLNFAGYAQYISPKFFNKIQITLSGRYDQQTFDYTDLYDTNKNKPILNKKFDEFTPRLAIIIAPTKKIAIKAIAGKAFRTPAPTEMFGFNTFTLASNIKQVKAENVTNIDIGIEWQALSKLKFTTNLFVFKFENQIAYSLANNNLSTNIYTLTNAGHETELVFSLERLNGFVNYTGVYRLDEEIKDTTIHINKNAITWAPSSFANVGFSYSKNKFFISFQTHYQGEVKRRKSDTYREMLKYRNQSINAWINADAKISYLINKNIEAGITAKNILNKNQYLVKNYAYPFDYRREPFQLFGELIIRL